MIVEALRRSVGVARVHPWVTLALGAALVLAIASTFTGLGLVLAPWFVCEVFALCLSASGVATQPRGTAWIQAALVVLGVGVLFGSVVALAALVFGPDLAAVDRASVLPWGQSALRIVGIFAISITSLAFVLPFMHVPAIQVERGGPFGTSVLESVWLVRTTGALASFRLVCTAGSFALLPAIAAAVASARLIDRASTPLGVVLSAPLLLLSLPVGLGVVAQGYLLERHRLPPRHLVTRRPVARSTTALLTAAVLAPVGGLVLLLVACALPAPLLRSELPASAIRLAERAEGTVIVPGSTLALTLTPRHAAVLPAIDDEPVVLTTPASRSGRRPFERARVYALHDLYAIEVFSEGDRREGWAMFDGAGARIDDTVHRALDERMGIWRALIFGPTFLIVALLVLAALGPLAESRTATRTEEEVLSRAETRAHRLGWLLVPFWGVIVALGWLAVAGL